MNEYQANKISKKLETIQKNDFPLMIQLFALLFSPHRRPGFLRGNPSLHVVIIMKVIQNRSETQVIWRLTESLKQFSDELLSFAASSYLSIPNNGPG